MRISKMKNINHRKFERQVNHLQSFVGMPHWNYRNPSIEEIREFDRRILEQQANDYQAKRSSVLSKVFSWIFKSPTTAFDFTAKAATKKKAIKAPIITDADCCI